jgi:hypothetical protein
LWIVLTIPLTLLTVAAYTVDSQLVDHARTTTAVITSVDETGSEGDSYTWQYTILGATCTGKNSDRSPFPKVGSRIVVYYSAINPCDSLDYSPGRRRQNDVTILAAFAVGLPLVIALSWGAVVARHPTRWERVTTP